MCARRYDRFRQPAGQRHRERLRTPGGISGRRPQFPGLGYYRPSGAQDYKRRFEQSRAQFQRPIDGRSTYLRAMSLARPLADHVLAQRDAADGARRSPDDTILMRDELTCFLVRCLLTVKLLPMENPRAWFVVFLVNEASRPREDPAVTADRKTAFRSGYPSGPQPLTITPRKAPGY